MLDNTIKAQLQAYLQRLQHSLELVVSLDDTEASSQISQLVSDIIECSDGRISLRTSEQLERSPSFGIALPGQAPRVVFGGLPLGHEFTSLVLALLQVGGHPPKIEPEVLNQARRLSGEMHFEVYMSLSCHNCPDVVQAANLLAIVNPSIRSTIIDGALFQAEVNERDIMAVPAVFLNGKPFASGRMELSEILTKLDTGGATKAAEQLSAKEPFDVLVVGAGPAGAAAAIYAARKGLRVGLVADRIGGQTNDTMGIENYISVLETTGPRYSADLAAHVRHYGVDVMLGQRAAGLVPAAATGGLSDVQLESGATIRGRTVVVATGARWRNVNVPGEQEYKNKGVAYCPHCDGPLFKGKRTAVIGGGNSGVEAAIDLAGLAAHVTLVEYGDKLKADAVLVDKLKSLPNVTILTQAQTTEFTGAVGKLNGVSYLDRATGEARHVELEGVFVQIGLVPNTEFTKGVLEQNRIGEILVDAHCHTSVPGVFAAGDGTSVPFKQIIVAAGEGAKAALSAFDHLIRST